MQSENQESPDRRQRILEGAGAAFLRFGFERASMADIAAGAGVSRTALYHYFPNKDDVLRAVVDQLHAKTLSAAADALASASTLEAALTGLLDARLGGMLRLLATSPHAQDLLDATTRLTASAAREADAKFLTMVVQTLEKHGQKTDAPAVADTLIHAAKGLMRSSENPATLTLFHSRLKRLTAWATH